MIWRYYATRCKTVSISYEWCDWKPKGKKQHDLTFDAMRVIRYKMNCKLIRFVLKEFVKWLIVKWFASIRFDVISPNKKWCETIWCHLILYEWRFYMILCIKKVISNPKWATCDMMWSNIIWYAGSGSNTKENI